jgi:hypothetical protein
MGGNDNYPLVKLTIFHVKPIIMFHLSHGPIKNFKKLLKLIKNRKKPPLCANGGGRSPHFWPMGPWGWFGQPRLGIGGGQNHPPRPRLLEMDLAISYSQFGMGKPLLHDFWGWFGHVQGTKFLYFFCFSF